MQALILAGGEGTRLRPLTSNVPKPVVSLVGRPFIGYMLDWLCAHGVDDVVMSCGFLAEGVRSVLGDGSDFGVRLRYVEETRPLGTGGALKFAQELLEERFFMLNGDVLTDIDLTAQLRQHEATGARATLALVGVEDPSAYGLVRTRADRSVSEFLEKPSQEEALDTNLVNAGAYILEREILAEMAPAGTDSRPGATGSTSARPAATCRRLMTSSRATSRPWSARACAAAACGCCPSRASAVASGPRS
jgi:mannose-1-phosphate guanylyltransferase